MFFKACCDTFFEKCGKRVLRSLVSLVTWPLVTIISFPKMIRIYRDRNIASVAHFLLNQDLNHGPEQPVSRNGCCFKECIRRDLYSINSIDANQHLLERQYNISLDFFRWQQGIHYLGIIIVSSASFVGLIMNLVALCMSEQFSNFNIFFTFFKWGGTAALLTPSAAGTLTFFSKELYIEANMHVINVIRFIIKPCKSLETRDITESRVFLYSKNNRLLELQEISIENNLRTTLSSELEIRTTEVRKQLDELGKLRDTTLNFETLENAPTHFPKDINLLILSYLFDQRMFDNNLPKISDNVVSCVSRDIYSYAP